MWSASPWNDVPNELYRMPICETILFAGESYSYFLHSGNRLFSAPFLLALVQQSIISSCYVPFMVFIVQLLGTCSIKRRSWVQILSPCPFNHGITRFTFPNCGTPRWDSPEGWLPLFFLFTNLLPYFFPPCSWLVSQLLVLNQSFNLLLTTYCHILLLTNKMLRTFTFRWNITRTRAHTCTHTHTHIMCATYICISW